MGRGCNLVQRASGHVVASVFVTESRIGILLATILAIIVLGRYRFRREITGPRPRPASLIHVPLLLPNGKQVTIETYPAISGDRSQITAVELVLVSAEVAR